MQLNNLINSKNVLFITTKNIDYIRNVQELNIIKNNAKKYKIIYSKRKSYIFRVVEIFFKLTFLSFKKYDIIFIGFAPQLILPFIFYRIENKTIVIDFFISLYDTIVNDRKLIKSKSLLSKILYFLDSYTIKKSHHVIVDTKADGKYFSKEYNYNIEKNEVIYLEADSSIYFPQHINKPEIYKNKFIVLYFGTVLPLQGVDVILDAYDKLKTDNQIVCFFIGKLNKHFVMPLSSNIKYIDWISQKELAKFISISDLCLAGHFSNNIDKAKRTIPGKAFIYNAMDKNIILGDNEANREYFIESDRIKFVPHGNSELLAKIILEEKNRYFNKL